MEIGETSKVNEIDVSGFYLFKSTENSGQINWVRDLDLNENQWNENKDKERLLLEKISDVEREIIDDRNNDNINILTRKSLKIVSSRHATRN